MREREKIRFHLTDKQKKNLFFFTHTHTREILMKHSKPYYSQNHILCVLVMAKTKKNCLKRQFILISTTTIVWKIKNVARCLQLGVIFSWELRKIIVEREKERKVQTVTFIIRSSQANLRGVHEIPTHSQRAKAT